MTLLIFFQPLNLSKVWYTSSVLNPFMDFVSRAPTLAATIALKTKQNKWAFILQ
jgi:hypothetical protein